MRVTHVTESLVGGPSTYLKMVVDHQLSLGWEVSIITDPKLLTQELAASGAELLTYRSSRSPLKVLGAACQVRKRLKESSPDLVHLHGTFAGLYARILGPLGVPTIYCPHGWAFVRSVSFASKSTSALIERYLSHVTDMTINVSVFEKKSALQWGIKRNQVVLLNSVREADDTGDKLFEPKPGVINLGFLGRLDYQKGFDLVLEAMKGEIGKSVHLWVAGAGYRGESRNWDQAGNVTYLGWLNSVQVDAFMNSIDALVMPSRWEGCPLAALEGMRSGKPLLSSDRCGLPELVIEGFNGLLYSIDTPEGIGAALSRCTPESLNVMGRRAREVFDSTFHPSQMLAKLDELYMSLLGGSARAEVAKAERGLSNRVGASQRLDRLPVMASTTAVKS